MNENKKKVLSVILYISVITILYSCVQIKRTQIPSADNYPSADNDPYNPQIQQLSSVKRLIVSKSYEKLGIPYQYGGSTIHAFDCSGLTQYVYREAGINIPRTTKLQLRDSQTIPYQHLLPGDLAFYKTSIKSRHVGIYIGNNQMIHASTSSKRVKITNITDAYWRQRFTKFGRFVKTN